jgi:hypothetical protein
MPSYDSWRILITCVITGLFGFVIGYGIGCLDGYVRATRRRHEDHDPAG